MAPLAYVLFSNMADRILLCIMGFLISSYSLYIEIQKEKNPSYRAYCDFNEHMSCSKVLTSSYARGFGVVSKLLGKDHPFNVRNCNLGIVFYIAYIFVSLCFSPATSGPILLFMSVIAVLMSCYLGFILFCVLHDMCIVCITTYVISGLLLYLSYSVYAHPW